jgi:hypothetical protein
MFAFPRILILLAFLLTEENNAPRVRQLTFEEKRGFYLPQKKREVQPGIAAAIARTGPQLI